MDDRPDSTHGCLLTFRLNRDHPAVVGIGDSCSEAKVLDPVSDQHGLIRAESTLDMGFATGKGSVVKPERGKTVETGQVKYMPAECALISWVQELVSAPKIVAVEADTLYIVKTIGRDAIGDNINRSTVELLECSGLVEKVVALSFGALEFQPGALAYSPQCDLSASQAVAQCARYELS